MGDLQLTLACCVCRKRKIRCGRELPCCLVCEQTYQVCEYPQRVSKPEPKIGTTRKSRKRQQESQDNARRQRRKSVSVASVDEELSDNISQTALFPEPMRQSNEFREQSGRIQSLSFIMHPSHESCALDSERAPTITTNTQPDGDSLPTASCVALGITPYVMSEL